MTERGFGLSPGIPYSTLAPKYGVSAGLGFDHAGAAGQMPVDQAGNPQGSYCRHAGEGP